MRIWIGAVCAVAIASASCHSSAERVEKQRRETAEFTTAMEAKPSGAAVADRESLPGAAVFAQRCAQCHLGQVPKAPSKTFLQLMPPDAIHAALTTGIMQAQAAGLSDAQKRQVARYLSGEEPDANARAATPPACTGAAARFGAEPAPAIRGWGVDERNTRFIPGDAALLTPADLPKLKLKWALAFPGALRARSQPTFALGAVFVGSQNGTVYALDAATGCVRWTFRASAEVRTPIVLSDRGMSGNGSGHPRAFFGDLVGRAYALDAITGELEWKQKVEDHPSATITGAPAYHEGRLYVPVSSLEEASADPAYACCTFRGSIAALDAGTGQTIWKSYTIDRPAAAVGKTKSGTAVFAPSGAPIWNSPTLDLKRGLIYVGTGNNYSAPANDRSDAILAFDLATGALRWSWQSVPHDAWNVGCMINNDNCPEQKGPDLDIGAGTMLAHTAKGDLILVGRKDGTVFALDPDKHDKPVWQNKLGRGSIQGGVQFGLAADATHLFIPISDMADSKNGDARSAEPGRPGMYALDPVSGRLLWSAPADNICNGRAFCDAGILAAATAIPGAVIAGHLDGRVRAYDAADGHVLFEYDSTQEVATVSGAKTRGGSIGGAGAMVHNGMLFVNSGYGLYFHMPGNALLAFSVDGK